LPSAKSVRVQSRRLDRNLPLRTRAKTYVTKARNLIQNGELADAEKAVQLAVVALDKAAQRGAIHRRNAARRKSRVMVQLAKAKAISQD
jgi:small subunit ribosomal protein S20